MNIKRIWAWSMIFGVLAATFVYFTFYSNLPVKTASSNVQQEAQEEPEIVEEELEPTGREMPNPIVEVSKGKRAISIKVNLEEGTSGYIEPESKVDIIAFETEKDEERAYRSAVLILENVKVLASGKSADNANEALHYDTVTVEVTPEEGLELGLTAKYKDGFYLMLRNEEDNRSVEKEKRVTWDEVIETVIDEGGDSE
ncbi:Flp pilus assembly protein CpaB [Bacillus sp. N9]